MVNTTITGTPGYLLLPTGGAMSGAGVCPKHVVRERGTAPVGSAEGFVAGWPLATRIDDNTLPSAPSGRVT